MPMDWRTAYLEQARSDHDILFSLLRANAPLCHCLHYLQMTTEKMAKGFLTRPGGTRYPNTHDAFVQFLQGARYRPEIQRACGFTQQRPFIAYLNSLTDFAQAVEDLSPEGGDHPNPEYPWEQNGLILSPLTHPFLDLDLRQQTPKMAKFLKFIADCFTVA